MLGEIDTMLMLPFLLTGMRCYGGPGWHRGEAERREYYRERTERAVAQLAHDDGDAALAALLVELLEVCHHRAPVLYPQWK
jgi:hypothetical protein